MSKSYIVTLQCDYEVEVERMAMDSISGYEECIVLNIEECED